MSYGLDRWGTPIEQPKMWNTQGFENNYDYAGDDIGGGYDWLSPSGLKAGGAILGGLGSVAQAYTGWQGLKLAKKQFALNRQATLANYANQAKAYNAQMEYRQNRRNSFSNSVRNNPNSSVSVGDHWLQPTDAYMQQYGANTNMEQAAAGQGYQNPNQAPPVQAESPLQPAPNTTPSAQGNANWLARVEPANKPRRV